jgi:Tfp pilus assembly protein PilV
LDLVLGWIIACIVLVQGASIEVLLSILIASAMLLGTVTYLTQTYEGEMSSD